MSVWAASDEALLAGLGTGDRGASLAFVRRFQRRVFGLALTIVNDEGRAEDVAQEAFVRAWRSAPSYDARRGSVATWLLTITRNLAIDSLRVERARPADCTPIIDLTLVAPGPQPDDVVGLDDDVQRVANAMSRLPAEQRRALVLAAMFGRTAREIGEMDGIPLGTAKTRIRTAVLRLREELGSEEHTP
jgi:RNA polymerase sigma-70 factor (ECF subfamily)